MNRHRILRAIGALWLVCAAAACAPKVQVETKDPIVINMNVWTRLKLAQGATPGYA